MNNANFARYLDEELGILKVKRLPRRGPDLEAQALLALAARLDAWQPGSVPDAHQALRRRWANRMNLRPDRGPRAGLPRWVKVAVPIFILLAALIFAFRQPLRTAFASMLGYGYSENAGFFRLEETSLLSAPVMQQHNGQSLTVLDGIAGTENTQLWVKASDPNLDYSLAWLETADGAKLPLQNWQPLNDSRHSGQVWMRFAALPGGQTSVTLVFPAGWHIPLQFISGTEWQQRTQNTPAAVVSPSATSPTAAALPSNPCVDIKGFAVCVRSAAYSSDSLQVFLGSDAGASPFTSADPGMYLGLAAANPISGDDQVVLEAGGHKAATALTAFPQGITFADNSLQQTLTFALDPSMRGTAKLTLPAVTAKVTLPQPVMITLDLGPHPVAGQSVALPADIQIAGQTIHFDRAEITGDGVNSLRLTLTSAPIQAENGWMISGLELGKPEGIADRYGAGSLDSERRLKVFTELFGDDGKIKTGLLNLPVVDATAVLLGPFEFTFDLPEANSNPVQLTPTLVSGDDFSPQPMSTPLSLQNYAYTGLALQPEELLFTVVHETTTGLYALAPQAGASPQWMATLPGQVDQVYVHPDLQGIDYLTGTLVTEPNTSPYFKNAQLFSLNFDEAGPRLLLTFPTGPSAMPGGGTELIGPSWSADGGIFAFILAGLQSTDGQNGSNIGWIDLNCRESGACLPQYVSLPATVEDFYDQQFSPLGRRLLYAATISSPTHGDVEKLYQMTFDATGQPGAITPVTQADAAMEQNPRWLPDGDSLLLICADMDSSDVNNNHLCEWNLATGQRTDLLDLNQYVRNPIMRNFELSPKGDLLVAGSDAGIQIFNRETRKLNLLPFSDFLNLFAFDGQEKNLYVLGETGNSIEAIDLSSMTMRTVYTQSGEGYVAWLGVVP
jgi:hypothetical protein